MKALIIAICLTAQLTATPQNKEGDTSNWTAFPMIIRTIAKTIVATMVRTADPGVVRYN